MAVEEVTHTVVVVVVVAAVAGTEEKAIRDPSNSERTLPGPTRRGDVSLSPSSSPPSSSQRLEFQRKSPSSFLPAASASARILLASGNGRGRPLRKRA